MNSSDLLSMVDIPTPDARPSRADRRRRAPGETDSSGAIHELRLVQQLLERNADAWQRFFSKYERLIYSRVVSTLHELGRTPQLAVVEDCCSEVVGELFRNDLQTLRAFEGRAKLSTWLAVITRRVTLRAVLQGRSRKEQQPGSDCDLNLVPAPAGRSSLSGELDCREIVLQCCLRKLSEADRLVLELHFNRGLSYEQIGVRMGITTNAVGPKLSRAQKRLKQLVARHRPQDAAESHTPKGSG